MYGTISQNLYTIHVFLNWTVQPFRPMIESFYTLSEFILGVKYNEQTSKFSFWHDRLYLFLHYQLPCRTGNSTLEGISYSLRRWGQSAFSLSNRCLPRKCEVDSPALASARKILRSDKLNHVADGLSCWTGWQESNFCRSPTHRALCGRPASGPTRLRQPVGRFYVRILAKLEF